MCTQILWNLILNTEKQFMFLTATVKLGKNLNPKKATFILFSYYSVVGTPIVWKLVRNTKMYLVLIF